MRILFWFILLFFVSSAPARAQWTEISSDHFVIYGEQDAKVLARFAERLELLHAAMKFRHAPKMEKPSPSNRVTIYAVSSPATVRKLVKAGGTALAGIYIPRAGATMALTPKINSGMTKFEAGGEVILYHEYAHHFMGMLTSYSLPKWASEGLAEFYASLKFDEDSVGVGLPAYHRTYEFAYGIKVPIHVLLRAEGDSGTSARNSSFYAQSWLLLHYLTFTPARANQFERYMALLSQGVSDLDAARQAFGDLETLSDDLDGYFGKNRLNYLRLSRKGLSTGEVSARQTSEGHAEAMSAIIRAQRGVDQEEAQALAIEMRTIAQRHPQDPEVLIALGEAEIDSGQFDAGLTALNQVLASNPQSIKALIQKGRALFAKAESSGKEADWQAVRAVYLAANRIEMDHPIPLIQFYRTFLEQGIAPSKSAIAGLKAAARLAPFDHSLLLLLAAQLERDGQWGDAIRALGPIAYNPHRSEASAQAVSRIADLQKQIDATNKTAKPARASYTKSR